MRMMPGDEPPFSGDSIFPLDALLDPQALRIGTTTSENLGEAFINEIPSLLKKILANELSECMDCIPDEGGGINQTWNMLYVNAFRSLLRVQ